MEELEKCSAMNGDDNESNDVAVLSVEQYLEASSRDLYVLQVYKHGKSLPVEVDGRDLWIKWKPPSKGWLN
ncbi:hypothetical protein VNO77_43104 [Canavalia gladiata]|uniref:Uncharacterized protein n=1 Tax=Canavalia gladiata TaxID=3824 RepID=A0AAN9JVW0_CANGL